MIKGFARVLLFGSLSISAVALNGGKGATGAMTRPDEIAAQRSAEKTQLEIDKLRLDIQAAKDQQGLKESIKGWIATGATLITIIGAIATGFFVVWKFVLGQEAYPHIEFTADINIIGEQEGRKIVELIAYVENKGSAMHEMKELVFDLNGIFKGETPEGNPEIWAGETNFKHGLGKGSFLPEKFDFFFVDPGVKAKYSKILDVPPETTFLMLHCHFKYRPRLLSYSPDGPNLSHTAERTICLLPTEAKVKDDELV